MKAAACWGNSGKGIKDFGTKIFNPKIIRIHPSILLTIFANMEFIMEWF
jgi:hypothetical protein